VNQRLLSKDVVSNILNSPISTGDYIHIVNVYLYLESDTTEYLTGQDTNNVKIKFSIDNISISTFMLNLDKYSIEADEESPNQGIGINPIIIFHGISWSNIVYIYKLHNETISGGSISRRHKLSALEYRLSLIIMLLKVAILNSVSDSYNDKIFTSTKIDYDYYIYRLKHQVEKGAYIHNNSVILRYFLANKAIKLIIGINRLKADIEKVNLEIKYLESNTELKKQMLEDINIKMSRLTLKISSRGAKSLQNLGATTGRLRLLRAEKLELEVEISNQGIKLTTAKLTLSGYLEQLRILEAKSSEVQNEILSCFPLSQSSTHNFPNKGEGKKSTSLITNKRAFHTSASLSQKDSIYSSIGLNTPVFRGLRPKEYIINLCLLKTLKICTYKKAMYQPLNLALIQII